MTDSTMTDSITIAQFVAAHDFQWFAENRTMQEAVNEVKAAGCSWFKKDIRMLISQRKPACRFWLKKLRGGTTMKLADDEYWDELKIVVEKNAPLIAQGGIDTAVRIVRLEMPTNPALLYGLPKRLHVWKNDTELKKESKARGRTKAKVNP